MKNARAFDDLKVRQHLCNAGELMNVGQQELDVAHAKAIRHTPRVGKACRGKIDRQDARIRGALPSAIWIAPRPVPSRNQHLERVCS